VISNARSHEGLDVPLLDLLQEGMLGLVRATEKFDWRKGYKFSTYATFWIRESIQRAIANRARPIRIPVHIGEEETTLGALLASDATALHEEVEIAARDDALRRALERLPEAERNVVRLRYGIDGDEPTPLREAGRRLGISLDAVRKLERKALASRAAAARRTGECRRAGSSAAPSGCRSAG
jgi:RNA polymerase primary sigma factor